MSCLPSAATQFPLMEWLRFRELFPALHPGQGEKVPFKSHKICLVTRWLAVSALVERRKLYLVLVAHVKEEGTTRGPLFHFLSPACVCVLSEPSEEQSGTKK